jgi:predicted amidohydrolase YtcJ
VLEPDELTARVMAAHARGWQVAVHGNGDAAIDAILDAYEAALRAHPRPDHRHRIEHCQTVRPDQLDRMAGLGVRASFFVAHTYYWGDRHRDRFLGPDRADRISPLRSARARGIRFGLHSDAPVTPVSPLRSVAAAVTRRTAGGATLGPHERVPVQAALAAVTLDAAALGFDDPRLGSIAPGKRADLVILSDDPEGVPADDLARLAVEVTIIDGEVVHP